MRQIVLWYHGAFMVNSHRRADLFSDMVMSNIEVGDKDRAEYLKGITDGIWKG